MKAIRGAIFIDEDTKDEVRLRTSQLMEKIYEINGISDKDIISVIFSVTKDITSLNPATAFREAGHDLPLMCFQEAEFDGAHDMTIRVIVFANCENVKHVYENGAEILRSRG